MFTHRDLNSVTLSAPFLISGARSVSAAFHNHLLADIQTEVGEDCSAINKFLDGVWLDRPAVTVACDWNNGEPLA